MTELPLEAYRFALTHTVDSVVITDLESVIVWANPAFTETTGFAREEAIGRKPSILRSRHTTDETYREMWSVILAGGWWRGEIINVTKGGDEWTSLLSISRVDDREGQPLGYVGIARDISPMKALQQEVREAGLEAIFMLSVACEAKDESTGHHIRRVQHLAEALARRMGIDAACAEEIGYSSMMHDVGKLHVPDRILKKLGRLDPGEWEEMRMHPEHGVKILRGKPFYETARQIALNHHERWNGSGYPAGKRGKEIPLPARIVAVADVFDALTSARSYKTAWGLDRALAELEAQAGQTLDPRVVEAFRSLGADGTVAAIRGEFPAGAGG